MRVFIQALVKILPQTGIGSLPAAFWLVLFAVTAAAQSSIPAPPLPPRVVQAQRFLARRGLKPGLRSTALRPRRAASSLASPEFTAGQPLWQPLGPQTVLTP